MSIIYSRHRFKPKKIFFINNKKNNTINKIIFILFIVFMLIGIVLASVTPVFLRLCKNRAKNKATIMLSEEIKKAVKEYNYSDFIIIHNDENGKAVMLESNMVNINSVISNITKNIQQRIDNEKDEDIKISLGSFTGISLLSGRGYGVPIRISTIGNINSNIKSEFSSEGINQTIHRLYLNIKCEISILTPFNTVTEEVENKVIIAENIIVGSIPETYYNIEGMEASAVLDVIE